MFKYLTAALLLLAITATYADVSFKSNVSLNVNARNDWQYRKVSIRWVDGVNLGWFSSLSVAREGNQANGDLIIGGVHGGSVLTSAYPSAFLAYITASYDSSFDQNKIFTWDSSIAGNFIASAYLNITETDASGNVADSLDLSKLGSWDRTASSNNGSLQYVTVTGKKLLDPTFSGFSISFTFVVASQVGIINLANAVVTPKMLETIVEINSWPYKSASNTLTLYSVSATGSGSADKNLVVSGSGATQVYYQVATKAEVDGSTKGVTVTSTTHADANLLPQPDIRALLKSKFTGSVNVQVFASTFPAGANSITYDPTLGSGATVEQQQSATPTSAVSNVVPTFVLAAVVCVFALFL